MEEWFMEIDNEHTDTRICPYCWEDNDDDGDMIGEWCTWWTEKCTECKKEYKWEAEFDVSYTTEK